MSQRFSSHVWMWRRHEWHVLVMSDQAIYLVSPYCKDGSKPISNVANNGLCRGMAVRVHSRPMFRTAVTPFLIWGSPKCKTSHWRDAWTTYFDIIKILSSVHLSLGDVGLSPCGQMLRTPPSVGDDLGSKNKIPLLVICIEWYFVHTYLNNWATEASVNIYCSHEWTKRRALWHFMCDVLGPGVDQSMQIHCAIEDMWIFSHRRTRPSTPSCSNLSDSSHG